MNPVPKIKRYINETYLEYIRKQPCLVCPNRAEPHHWKSRGSGGSDLLCVPVCRSHHRELEQTGINKFCEKYNKLSNAYFQEEIIRLLCGYIVLEDE